MNATIPGTVQNYLRTLRQVLLQPKSFFRGLDPNEKSTKGLVFAIVTQWIGSALFLLWNGASKRSAWMEGLVDRIQSRWATHGPALSESWLPNSSTMPHAGQEWITGVASVIITPFTTLFTCWTVAFFLHLGARIFTARPIDKVRAMHIATYCTASSILLALPWVGGALSAFWSVILLVTATKQTYSVGTLRAFAISFFPYLAFAAMMGMFLALLLTVGIALVSIFLGMSVV